MTETQLLVYVPCAPFTVEVDLGTPDGPTAIETFILRALHAARTLDADRQGADRGLLLDDLDSLFGLGKPLMLDLIVGLRRAGLIRAHVDTGRIVLTAAGARSITSPTGASAIETNRRSTARITLVQDGLTGRPVAPVRANRVFDPRLRVPIDTELRTDLLRNRWRREMIRVAQDRIRSGPQLPNDKPPDSGPDTRVLDLCIVGASVRSAGERRFLRLRIVPRFDSDADSLTFDVLDVENSPREVCAEYAQALNTLSGQKPEDPFFKSMREAASISASTERPVVIASALIRRALDAVVASTPDLPSIEQDIEGLATRWLHEKREADGRRVHAQWLLGGSENDAAIRDLILNATRQVVLTCPFVKFDAFVRAGFWDALETKAREGVIVFLLWGYRHGDRLDDGVQRAVSELNTRCGGRFIVPLRSARTHAKVVVQDDSRIVITSYNYLDPSRSETIECGVELSRPNGGSSLLIQETLELVRACLPDYDLRTRLRTSFFDIGWELDDVTGLLPKRLVRLPAPGRDAGSRVEPLPTPRGGDVSRVAIELWRADWQRFVDGMDREERANSTTAHLVANAAHRAALWDALRETRRRLLISSDKLSSDVAHPAFLGALRRSLERGVQVVLLYRRPGGGIDSSDATWLEFLAPLRADYPERFQVVDDANHAKLLVSDDFALVSSFNFLSIPDAEGNETWNGLRQAHELGCKVSGVDVIDRLISRLAIRTPQLKALLPASSDSTMQLVPDVPRDHLVSVSSLRVLVDDVAHAGTQQKVRGILDQWFRTSPTAANDLLLLRDAELPSSLLRVATASYLATIPHESWGVRERGWCRGLAEQAWRSGQTGEAWVLSQLCPAETSDGLELLVRAVLVRRKQELIDDLFASLTLSPSFPEGAVDGLALLATLAFLSSGSAYAVDLAERTAMRGAPIVAEWTTACLAYWRATQSPLRLRELHTHADVRGAIESAEVVRGAALARIRGLARADAKVKRAAEVVHGMCAAEGEFGQLDQFLEARDLAQVAVWLAANHALRRDPGRVLDQKLRELALARGVDGFLRKSLSERIRAISDGAAEWHSLWSSLPDGATEAGLLAHVSNAARLATELRTCWRPLEDRIRADSPADLAVPVIRLLVAELDPVRRLVGR